jgi:hypothetical protein
MIYIPVSIIMFLLKYAHLGSSLLIVKMEVPFQYHYADSYSIEFSSEEPPHTEELLCQTAGVPLDLLIPEMDDTVDSERNKTFMVAMALSMKCADAVAFNMRSILTNDAYQTYGGVSDTENLLDAARSWEVKTRYRKVLKSIAKRFGVSLEGVIACDMSFRMKRCRGKCNFTGADGVVRTFVLFNSQVDSYVTWFDIVFSKSNCAATRRLADPPSAIARRQTKGKIIAAERDMQKPRWPKICDVCGMPDTKQQRIQRCDRCKIPGYCSRDCQIVDWRSHKKVCGLN